MSDNSVRGIRKRHAEAAIEIVDDRLARIENDARAVKDHLTIQVVGRVGDAIMEAREMIDRVFADSVDDAEDGR